MNNEHTIFEQAITEPMRVCLKVSQLFAKIDGLMAIDSPWASEGIARAVIDILSALDRSDIKAKLNKLLQQHLDTLSKHQQSSQVNQQELGQLLQTIKQCQQTLLQTQGKLLQDLRDNQLIRTIKQCLSQPGGACSHEAPAFHHWLMQPSELRQHTAEQWLQIMQPMRAVMDTLLYVLRGSHGFTLKCTTTGFYEQRLVKQHDCQLIRIKVPKDLSLYPEVSANRQHLNIRFQSSDKQNTNDQPVQFELAICH